MSKECPDCRKYIRNYVHRQAILLAYERSAAPLDRIAELWFDRLEDGDRCLADPEYRARIRPDELQFTDHPNLLWLVTQEATVIDEGEQKQA
jgi:hypothetical protein